MHALCFVSRYPYLQLFRSLLFQLFGFGLVEQHAGSVRTFLDIIYTRAVSNVTSGSSQEHASIAVARALMPEFLHDFTVSAPLRPQLTTSVNPGAGAGVHRERRARGSDPQLHPHAQADPHRERPQEGRQKLVV